ncbi:MAG: AMP-binding protein, partial [Cyanobacteriota bacterium]
MAETTLIVSGGLKAASPVVKAFKKDALEQNRVVPALGNSDNAQTLVGSGQILLDQRIVIVHPETLTRCLPDEVGEIWVSGRSIVQGYWNQSEETERTFRAYLIDTGEGPFLRTGDLGFLQEGELFICGRLKDLIIIRGRNHYPQDVELTVEQSHPSLQPSCGAAFSVEVDGQEQLVVVQEIDRHHLRNLDTERVIGAIRQAVAEQHELQVYAVLLLKPSSILKTSSGKIQRRACRNSFLEGTLHAVASSILDANVDTIQSIKHLNHKALLALDTDQRLPLLKAYLQQMLAQMLKIAPSQLAPQQPLNTLGLDSLMVIELQSHIESLGLVLSLDSFSEELSVTQLANKLVTANLSDASKPTSLSPLVSHLPSRYQPFPLTDVQQANWVGRSSSFELGNVACHFYQELDCVDLDLERYTVAWQKLVLRHDMLRAIVLPDGQQQILEQVPFYEIKVLDLQGQDPQAVNNQLDSIRHRMSHQVLPSDRWPLFEIRASRLDNHRTRIHISFDLLIADVWSFEIIFRELDELYQNPEVLLTPLKISFRDYVLTQVTLQNSERYQRALDYWQKRLPTLPPGPELPLAKKPASLKIPRFKRSSASLEPTTWQQLKIRSTQAGLTPSVVLLAAFAEVLTVWSKNPRFTLNLTLFNRLPLHPQVNDIVGDFTSLTLLAVDNSAPEIFKTRARHLHKQLWEALEYRYISGVRVLRELARTKGETARAIAPIVFTSTLGLGRLSQNSSLLNQLGSPGDVVYSISQTPQVWLDHQVFELDGALVFNWDFVEDLFPPGLLDDMFDAYCLLLKRLATEEEVWQATTRELLPTSHLELQLSLNATQALIEQQQLQTLFIAQLPQRSHQAAVVTATRSLTYEELYCQSNQLGHLLRQLGARPNRLVGVVMEKGWEQVVSVLAILASGAAYVPIDPALPQERRWHLLEQAEVKLVLTQSWIDATLVWPEDINRIHVDTFYEAETEALPLEPVQQPEDLAYVIYTSGSTGLPKGVMIDHRGAVNTILDINQRFSVEPDDRVL